MSPSDWDRIQNVFHTALEHSPLERASYLDATCAGNAELRKEVDSLLQSHDQNDDFLETPAFDKSVRPQGWKPNQNGMIPPGTVIGYYEIQDLLGAGGMGEVYRAKDRRLDREVAFKILSTMLTGQREQLHRFEQEVRAVSALNHPNICHLYDLGEWEQRPFFTMELLNGETLHQHIGGRPLPVAEVLEYGVQISDALDTAHSRGILHRDIKPANIFITTRGQIKVVDFGLAKRAAGHEQEETQPFTGPRTIPGTTMGTLAYMSPEQARAEALDARSDLFSFGSVLYEMATGTQAFGAISNGLIFDAIMNRAPARPSQLNPNVPEMLEALIETALEKDRELRHQSASEMKAALRRCARTLNAPLSHLEPHKTAPRMPAPNATHAPAAPTISIVGARTIAVLPFSLLHGEHADDEYLGVGLADALITKLSSMRRLQVRPTNSVMKYARQSADLLTAGRELDVAFVIGGLIRRFGSRVRVSVQLMQVSDGAPVWAAQFDENFTDILNLEDSISSLAAKALIPRLDVDEREQLSRRDTQNAQAYESYLKGRYYWNTYSVEGMSKALLNFTDAITKDPGYARAHAGIADYYNWVGAWSVLPAKESFAAAKQAADTALNLDSNRAETQTSYAYSVWNHDWDWEQAEKHYRRAIEINPTHAPALRYLALLLSAKECHQEAIELIERALAVDPFAPVMGMSAGLVLYNAGQFDRSIEMSRKTSGDQRGRRYRVDGAGLGLPTDE